VEWFVDTSGLVAIVGHRDASQVAAVGLHLLQDRGVAGAGLAVADGDLLRFRRIEGPVDAGFGPALLEQLPGSAAIGQVFGRIEPDEVIDSDRVDSGMVYAHHRGGPLAIAVHGRFTNGNRLRRELVESGTSFFGRSDAELLLHLVAGSPQKTFVNRLVDALWRVEGAYVVLVLSQDHLVAVRDPSGFRPLVLGWWGDALMLATEDGPIHVMGGEVRREIRPGEMLVCDVSASGSARTAATQPAQGPRAALGAQSVAPFPPKPPSACVQEYVSLARSDAVVFGRSSHAVRMALGEKLATELPCPEAEIVCGLPETGEAVAIGYARASGLPYEPAILRDDPPRKMLEPPSHMSDFGSRMRWRVVPSIVAGRAVVLVLPTVSTGKLLRLLVQQLLEAGARAVHLRVASPPALSPCPYGVASPMPEELLFARSDVEPKTTVGAHSLGCLSLAGLREVIEPTEPGPLVTGEEPAQTARGFCDACFSGRRPIEPEKVEDQLPLF
jgi:amidophosphoribosyltransferase